MNNFVISSHVRDMLNLYDQEYIHYLEVLEVKSITDRTRIVNMKSIEHMLSDVVSPDHTHMVLGDLSNRDGFFKPFIYGSYTTEQEANLVLTTLEILRS